MCKPSTRFADILDSCVTAIEEHGKTVAECLAQYPDQREELEPLLHLVARLRAARTLQAPSEFRRTSTLRVRNIAAAEQRRIDRTVTGLEKVPRDYYGQHDTRRLAADRQWCGLCLGQSPSR